MSGWEIWTWMAILILGPGALAVILFALRDGKHLLGQIGNRKGEKEPPSHQG